MKKRTRPDTKPNSSKKQGPPKQKSGSKDLRGERIDLPKLLGMISLRPLGTGLSRQTNPRNSRCCRQNNAGLEDLFKEEPEVAPITQEVDHGHDLQTQPDLLG